MNIKSVLTFSDRAIPAQLATYYPLFLGRSENGRVIPRSGLPSDENTGARPRNHATRSSLAFYRFQPYA